MNSRVAGSGQLKSPVVGGVMLKAASALPWFMDSLKVNTMVVFSGTSTDLSVGEVLTTKGGPQSIVKTPSLESLPDSPSVSSASTFTRAVEESTQGRSHQ